MWLFLVIGVIWLSGIVGLAAMVVYAVHTGRLPNKHLPVSREVNPKTFWRLVSLWIILIAGMAYFAFFVASAPGIGLI